MRLSVRVRITAEMYRCCVSVGVALLLTLTAASCAKKKHIPAARARLPRTQPGPIVSPEFGLASWYGHPYHGRPAADGEIYDMEQLTAAHRTLPFGTWVRITNLANQKLVDVRIIDRGPFVDGRIIDLSHAAAREIEVIGPGVAQIRLDVLSTPPLRSQAAWFAVQVGAFRERSRAEGLRMNLAEEYGTAQVIMREGNPPLWRVLAGREASEDQAGALADRLRSEVGPAFVVRLDQ